MMLPFPFNFYLLAFLAGAVITAMLLPIWRRWCLRIGMIDDPGHRKIHVTPTPLAGGVSVLSGLFIPLLGGLALPMVLNGPELQPAISYGLTTRSIQLLTILFCALGMVMLGAADDRLELSPQVKFGGQLLFALATAATGIRITLFIESDLFSYVVTVLWILTITNALNFLDNMNGLCAGLGLIACWGCGWSAAVHGQYLVALLAFQMCGALLGYLPYNFPKAAVFLGDSGSHLVGYLTAVLAVLPNYYTEGGATRFAVLAPLLILAVPLFDPVSVVIIRMGKGQPVWVGDTNHISHRLVRRGFSKSTTVLLIWLAAAAVAFVSSLLL